jgi:DNA-binding MarR family transcriptional regulator
VRIRPRAGLIGIDDESPRPDDEAVTAADDFCEAFPAAFLAFHRRDGRRGELTNASRAVLQHLAVTGPVSIGEAARHLERAQSVVSEIVTQLESHGLLEREPDPDNRRRTLVWLTEAGFARLRDDADVLDRRLVAAAMTHLDENTQRGLIEALHALVAAAGKEPE